MERKHFGIVAPIYLAEALEALYTQVVKLGIGPAIDNGFYYDVDFGDHPIFI